MPNEGFHVFTAFSVPPHPVAPLQATTFLSLPSWPPTSLSMRNLTVQWRLFKVCPRTALSKLTMKRSSPCTGAFKQWASHDCLWVDSALVYISRVHFYPFHLLWSEWLITYTATIGNVKSPRPGIWDMLGRAKWYVHAIFQVAKSHQI